MVPIVCQHLSLLPPLLLPLSLQSTLLPHARIHTARPPIRSELEDGFIRADNATIGEDIHLTPRYTVRGERTGAGRTRDIDDRHAVWVTYPSSRLVVVRPVGQSG